MKLNQVNHSKPKEEGVAPPPHVIPNVLPAPDPKAKQTKRKGKDDAPMSIAIPTQTQLANVHAPVQDTLQVKRSALTAMQLQTQAQTRTQTQIQARVPTNTTAQTRVQAIAPTQTRVQTQPRVQASIRVQTQARAPAQSQELAYSEVVSHPDLLELIYEGFSSTNTKRHMTCTFY